MDWPQGGASDDAGQKKNGYANFHLITPGRVIPGGDAISKEDRGKEPLETLGKTRFPGIPRVVANDSGYPRRAS